MSSALDWEQRRAIIVDRIAREREELGELTSRMLRPVRRMERVTERAGFAVRRLAPLAIPIVLLLLLRPRRILRLGGRVIKAYGAFLRFRRLLSV